MAQKIGPAFSAPARFLRRAFLFITVGALLILFGRYPSAGIPDGTTKINISRRGDEAPIITLTSAAEIQQARDAAGIIWNSIAYNSLEEQDERYRLSLTGSEGSVTSFWITRSEWSDHARTPRSFIAFIKQKQAEQQQGARQ